MATAAGAVEAAGVWADADVRPRTRRRKAPAGVWQEAADVAGLEQWRPQLASDIERREVSVRGERPFTVLCNPRDLVHLRVVAEDVAVLPLLDGSRTVDEVAVEHLQQAGSLDVDGVVELVSILYEGGFLTDRYVDVYADVQDGLTASRTVSQRIRRFLTTFTISWSGADGFVRWLYEHGVRTLFRPWFAVVGLVVAVAGLAAFADLVASDRVEFGAASTGGAAIVVALSLFLTFVHELGHAGYLVHRGRRIIGAGFQVYFGTPSFFVDASDGLMIERRGRIVQALLGPFAELIVAGTVTMLVWAFPDMPGASSLYAFALLNYFVIFLNLVPMLELDGYWVLSELTQQPDLRPRSLSFLRHDLWQKLRRRSPLSVGELGLTLYAVLGVLFTGLAFAWGISFWWRLFGTFVRGLWDGGPVTRVLLAALVIVVAGPVLRSLMDLVRAVLRRVRAIVDSVRFRLELGWRKEAAALLDELPLVGELSVDALEDLAGRVRLVRARPGQSVIVQGDPSDAFYVVRAGTLDVVEEMDGGSKRVLHTLEQGESFGELGLLERARRAAGVVARTEAELFEVDRASFEAVLADVVDAPRFAPTFQRARELQALPCFRRLGTAELLTLLESGAWVELPAGHTVVKQGDKGDAFYAVESGQVAVIRNRHEVARLGPGDWFGEYALLHRAPRSATVRTITPVRAFRVDRVGFNRVMRSSFRRTKRGAGDSLDQLWHH